MSRGERHCLIHQTNFLLDRRLRELELRFLREGGFRERLYPVRLDARRLPSGPAPPSRPDAAKRPPAMS